MTKKRVDYPYRQVVKAGSRHGVTPEGQVPTPKWWVLQLECGHTQELRIPTRSRRSGGPDVLSQPRPPARTRCFACGLQ